MVGMTTRERVMAAVKGEPVDRVPASFFEFNHLAERSSDMTAANLLEQNSRYNWDFIKVNLRSSYYAEAWGCKYRWDPQKGSLQQVDHVIKSASDFRKLEDLDPTKGVFGDQVRVAKLLGEALKGSTPYVQTVYTPLSVAARLAGAKVGPSESDEIRQFMREDPEALHDGLQVITQTLADYAKEAIRAGADGIFLATTMWSRDTITEEDYKIFGRTYDLPILEAVIQEGATFNVLHLCRENIMFDLLSDYPVQVINYDALSPRNPSLREAMGRTDKALWGGVDHKVTLLKGPVSQVVAEVQAALEQTGGKRLFIGPGCATQSQVPEAYLLAIKKVLSTWEMS